MALKILYQTKEKSRNSNQEKYRVTYYGKEAEIDQFIATLTIGTSQAQGCYLSSFTKSNYGADLYQVECEYTQSFQWGQYSNVGNTVVGQKSATLSVRNLQLPLEHLSDYLMNWNHYLIQKTDDETAVTTPSWWASAGYDDLIPIADRDKYRWIKSLSEIPLQPDSDGMYWYVVEKPEKPGVQFYDWAVFVVTESARYRSASSAGNAVAKTINTITAPSNTFGLTGGNWKHDQSSISYDGKSWIVTSVYTLSGDSEGWDTDIYGS